MLELNIGDAFQDFILGTGIANMDWRQIIMIAIACILIYLAIAKQYEPLLLLPIAFGMLLANLPIAGLMDAPIYEMANGVPVVDAAGNSNMLQPGGLLWYLYRGVKLGIFPPLIFLGVGCMTDFGPLIANPKAFCWERPHSWAYSSRLSVRFCWALRHRKQVLPASLAVPTALQLSF